VLGIYAPYLPMQPQEAQPLVMEYGADTLLLCRPAMAVQVRYSHRQLVPAAAPNNPVRMVVGIDGVADGADRQYQPSQPSRAGRVAPPGCHCAQGRRGSVLCARTHVGATAIHTARECFLDAYAHAKGNLNCRWADQRLFLADAVLPRMRHVVLLVTCDGPVALAHGDGRTVVAVHDETGRAHVQLVEPRTIAAGVPEPGTVLILDDVDVAGPVRCAAC